MLKTLDNAEGVRECQPSMLKTLDNAEGVR
jgi:hypothetical protein